MGILDKNKKSSKSVFNSTNSSNLCKNGTKKASYSISSQMDAENIDPKEKTNELAEQDEIYHDNPAFELEPTNQEMINNPFENENSKKASCNNESFQLETQNQTSNWTNLLTTNSSLTYIDSTDIKNFDQLKDDFYNLSFNHQGISTLTSINNTEKLAAAAAAAVSSTAESLVEVPNFGQELSSIMKQNRMDEIEIGSKKTDSTIVQNTGFVYGENNSLNKNMKKSPSSNAIGDLATLDDDAKLKLTGTSASYDIRIRQRRACHLKALVILVAMLTAAFIGCIFTYYYMRYQMENQKYLSYTQNMVLERASKLGSNKLEVVVPFTTNVTDIKDKNILVNKIEEIVHQTFSQMNKTVDLMQLYELNEINTNLYEATIDVELKDASDFSNVILRKESETRIKIDDSSDILKTYRKIFLNVTLGLNILPEILSINVSDVEILYDFKMMYSTSNQTGFTTHSQDDQKLSEEKFLLNSVSNEKANTNRPKLLSSIISSTPSIISQSAVFFMSSTIKSNIDSSLVKSTHSLSIPSRSVETQLPNNPSPTTQESIEPSSVFITNGISRILSTTAGLVQNTSEILPLNFSPKISEKEIESIDLAPKSHDKTELKLFNDRENSVNTNFNLKSSSARITTDILSNKVLIADIQLNNEDIDLNSHSVKAEKENNHLEEQIKSNQDENFSSKSSTNVSFDSGNNGLDIVLQIDGSDSRLLNRLIEKINKK